MEKNLYYVIGYWYTLNEDDHSKVVNQSRIVAEASSAEDVIKYFTTKVDADGDWVREISATTLAGAYNKKVDNKNLFGVTFRIEVLPLRPEVIID